MASSAMTMQQGSPASSQAASPDKGDHAGAEYDTDAESLTLWP